MAETAQETTEQVEPQETTEPGGEEQQPKDLNAQVESLNSKVDQLIEGAKPAEETPGPNTDLIDRLLEDFPDGEEEQQQGQEQQAEQPEPEGEEADAAALAAFIQQNAAQIADQRVGEFVNQQEMQRREGELDSLAEQYPDIAKPEYFDRIKDELWKAAEVYGESILTDPEMVKRTFFAMKQQEAAAAEKERTEQAADGASLETAAGASFQGKDSEEAQRRAIMTANKGGSIL